MKWVTDHMDDSEENTHKPLLLEEFGKIVWEKDFVKGMIEKKRNPVYEAMTGVTTDSVYACVSLSDLQNSLSVDSQDSEEAQPGVRGHGRRHHRFRLCVTRTSCLFVCVILAELESADLSARWCNGGIFVTLPH